jgi:hypothetical protein
MGEGDSTDMTFKRADIVQSDRGEEMEDGRIMSGCGSRSPALRHRAGIRVINHFLHSGKRVQHMSPNMYPK